MVRPPRLEPRWSCVVPALSSRLLALALLAPVEAAAGEFAVDETLVPPDASEASIQASGASLLIGEREPRVYSYAEGAEGFYDYSLATYALTYLEYAREDDRIGAYQDLVSASSTQSAFNLDNMRKSLSMEPVQLRQREGAVLRHSGTGRVQRSLRLSI